MISPEQVTINIVKKGIQNSLFNFSYTNRGNSNALQDLGMTISNICALTPGGILIFFPSYYLMEECYTQWES